MTTEWYVSELPDTDATANGQTVEYQVTSTIPRGETNLQVISSTMNMPHKCNLGYYTTIMIKVQHIFTN